MGYLLYLGIVNNDYTLIQGIVFILILGTATAVLILDLLLPLIDPRITYGKRVDAMTTTTPTGADDAPAAETPQVSRWNSPWLNPKLLIGLVMVLFILLMSVYRTAHLGRQPGPRRLIAAQPAAALGARVSGSSSEPLIRQ